MYINGLSYSNPHWGFITKNSEELACGVASPIENDDWTFICGTWDGTTNLDSIKFYVNGNLVGSGSPHETIVNGPARNLVIGQDSSGWGTDDSGHYFDGIIDEVRIYNRVLSRNEIVDLYHGE